MPAGKCRREEVDLPENYFINWQVEVFLDGEKIFEHIFNPEGQDILMACKNLALGDTLAFLPYVQEFQRVHNCKVSVLVRDYFRDLIKKFYPDLNQVEKITYDYYATYHLVTSMGEIFDMPFDSGTMPLETVCGEILNFSL